MLIYITVYFVQMGESDNKVRIEFFNGNRVRKICDPLRHFPPSEKKGFSSFLFYLFWSSSLICLQVNWHDVRLGIRRVELYVNEPSADVHWRRVSLKSRARFSFVFFPPHLFFILAPLIDILVSLPLCRGQDHRSFLFHFLSKLCIEPRAVVCVCALPSFWLIWINWKEMAPSQHNELVWVPSQ